MSHNYEDRCPGCGYTTPPDEEVDDLYARLDRRDAWARLWKRAAKGLWEAVGAFRSTAIENGRLVEEAREELRAEREAHARTRAELAHQTDFARRMQEHLRTISEERQTARSCRCLWCSGSNGLSPHAKWCPTAIARAALAAQPAPGAKGGET